MPRSLDSVLTRTTGCRDVHARVEHMPGPHVYKLPGLCKGNGYALMIYFK